MTIQQTEPHDLQGLLDQIKAAGENRDTVTIADIREQFGRRSFGPLLLFIGLVLMTPLSGVPGLPSFFGIIVMLTTGQMLIGRRELWLPQFILKRSLTRHNVEQFDAAVRTVARTVDRFIRPRLMVLTEGPFAVVVGALCFVSGFVMLPLEFVPFTSAIPGIPVAAFGLALMTHDGVFVIVGIASIAAAVAGVLIIGAAVSTIF